MKTRATPFYRPIRSELREPEWAPPILELVMAHEGIDAPPHITWLRSRTSSVAFRPNGLRYRVRHSSMSSSGETCGNEIIMRVGAIERDARSTFFHELAHWVTETGHTVSMYSKLFELVWLFGEPGDADYAYAREEAYMPAPAKAGWGRFSSRVRRWSESRFTIEERICVDNCQVIA